MSTAVGPGIARSPAFALGLLILALLMGVAIVALGQLAVLAVFAAMAFAFFLMYPVLGVFATTALLLLQGSGGIIGVLNEQSPVAITLAQLGGLAAISAWVANLLVRKRRLELNLPMILMGAFVLWALLSTIMGPYSESGLPHWARLAVRFAFFVLVVNVLGTRRNLQAYVIVVLACSGFMAASAVMQYFMPSAQFTGATAWAQLDTMDGAYIDQESLSGEAAVRVSGRAGHSNWLAMILLVVLPLNYFWFHQCKTRRMRNLVLGIVGMEVLALILTFTRTGFVIGAVIAFLFMVRGLVKVTPLRVFAALFALAIAWTLLPGPYKERVLSIGQYTSSLSVNSRIELQRAATRYTGQNPIAGLGVGGFGEEFVRERNQIGATMKFMVDNMGLPAIFIGTHNMYLQLTADTGVVGLVLYVLFFVLVLRGLFDLRRHYLARGDTAGQTLTDTVLIATIGFLICAVFLHALHQEIWWMLVSLAVALVHYRHDFTQPLPRWSLSTEARAK
jgi:O-antigen ligase